jgi:hypothetical protein
LLESLEKEGFCSFKLQLPEADFNWDDIQVLFFENSHFCSIIIQLNEFWIDEVQFCLKVEQ